MKKEYIIPETNVIIINLQPIASPSVTIDPTDPGVDPDEFDARRKTFGSKLWSDM